IAGLVPDRAGHVAVIIDNQIVFMGGSRFIPTGNPIRSQIRLYNLSDEVFSLSLSSQFTTSTAVLGGPTRVNVYLVGGVQQNLTRLNEIDKNSNITTNQTLLMIEEINKTYNMTDQSVFIYQPYGNTWLNILNQKGTPPTRRRSTSTVINQKGIIYIFGGRSQADTGHAVPVMLPNGKILYIGGVSQTQPGAEDELIDMNVIPVFDTISSTWSYKNTSQSILVQPRIAHTATLMPDNNEIIIIGGNSKPAEINSRIYLLDIQCKTWVTIFTPNRSICSNGSSIGSGSNVSNGPVINIGMIAGIIGSIIVVAVIVVAVLCIIKNRQETEVTGEPPS
ncbi:17972_t:CDS:2, partial [Gigaspora rosea]